MKNTSSTEEVVSRGMLLATNEEAVLKRLTEEEVKTKLKLKKEELFMR
ncbi:MAG: hypothetical protein GY820_02005 [Gammaproteobacteria bacterium]|nr:hypothetical protein [Gammaproteobacteria bacterium]